MSSDRSRDRYEIDTPTEPQTKLAPRDSDGDGILDGQDMVSRVHKAPTSLVAGGEVALACLSLWSIPQAYNLASWGELALLARSCMGGTEDMDRIVSSCPQMIQMTPKGSGMPELQLGIKRCMFSGATPDVESPHWDRPGQVSDVQRAWSSGGAASVPGAATVERPWERCGM